ncbi:MAG: Exodeoxyribonuclease 7 small subunit [Chlamydiae bacterium]|nr:Exodeoxyribonuclease 7 small subunit [Chlamydiota bacterium]
MTEEFNFEKSFARLEEILAKINSGKAPLDDSLKLYEEADKLITGCTARLTEAEERVGMLIKNRNGEMALDEENAPLTEDFIPQD